MQAVTLFDEMVAAYHPSSPLEKLNAQHQVMQQIALAGLQKGGFFEHAAFYGGTCLRIFHQLPRFSEDMDFTLVEKNKSIHLENYFDAIKDVFQLAGKDVELKKKDKVNFGRVESAFLKENTDVYHMAFTTEKSVKVKIELDTDPPLGFNSEYLPLNLPYHFMARCLTLPDLFAGKMNALVYRKWQTRIKGRDWYDFEWYVKWNIPLNFKHLQERIREFTGEDVTRAQFEELLRERLATGDIEQIKSDVLPFVINPHELDLWTNDYFLYLASKINWID
ncbi:MAG: nucleotidyl transferase AbiEii/AbiGii toxin family protein [Paludibacteraceae bacterium]|nr:nucleotidyl transferase AbiEii/AbiGii toxin family protein [Paludibacteraceae bacterium]